jgi:CPA1 family monovalent cation:H+ antiporter
VVGGAIAEVRRRIEDTPVEITISLATGYAAYLPAQAIGVSGVLAAVTAGIYLGWKAPEIASVNQRLQGRPVWELLQFLVNAVLFVLIGLQLPIVVDNLNGFSSATLLGYAAGVCAAVVGVRLIWFNTMPYVIRAFDRRPQQHARRVDWRTRMIVAWAGMRGAVSLAAALALPLHTDAGAAFPQRNLIIFLAVSVILFTLVVQGLTLPWLLRRLRVCDDGREEEDEEVLARLHASAAALERLEELAREDWTRDDTVDRLRRAYEYRQRRFNARRDGDDSDGYEDRSRSYQRLLRELLNAQRQAVVDLRNSGEISQDVMTRVERDLDLEDSRLALYAAALRRRRPLRSQITSASEMPWRRATSATSSQGSSASGSSSQRARSSPSNAPCRAGPRCCSERSNALNTSSCLSVILTTHMVPPGVEGSSRSGRLGTKTDRTQKSWT